MGIRTCALLSLLLCCCACGPSHDLPGKLQVRDDAGPSVTSAEGKARAGMQANSDDLGKATLAGGAQPDAGAAAPPAHAGAGGGAAGGSISPPPPTAGQSGKPARCAQTTCGAQCVNLQSDLDNCGACGNACQGSTCSLGRCRVTTCVAGHVDCDGTPDDCETDIGSDKRNCGGCGLACDPAASCVLGVCRCPNAGDLSCGGACIKTVSDDGNCGGCGIKCTGGQKCCASKCVSTAGNDPANCGACGATCGASGDACAAGKCTCGGAAACAAPQVCTTQLFVSSACM